MPVLESEDKIAPKSILRHRPIGNSNPGLGKRTIITSATTPIVPRASRTRRVDKIEEQENDNKDTTQSTQNPPTMRRVTIPPKPLYPMLHSKAVPLKTHLRQQVHPLLYLGVGMLAMLILWMMLSAVFGWFATTFDDMRYGRPRTFQTDAWVGHNEQTGLPSHFIAINLNSRIEVIELPGGDAAHSRIYVGPQLYGDGSDLVPVTLKFIDVNGDSRPDMILNFQGTHIVFINDPGGFRPPQPSERRQVEQFLQHLGQ